MLRVLEYDINVTSDYDADNILSDHVFSDRRSCEDEEEIDKENYRKLQRYKN